jgi:hypothetical protein
LAGALVLAGAAGWTAAVGPLHPAGQNAAKTIANVTRSNTLMDLFMRLLLLNRQIVP